VDIAVLALGFGYDLDYLIDGVFEFGIVCYGERCAGRFEPLIKISVVEGRASMLPLGKAGGNAEVLKELGVIGALHQLVPHARPLAFLPLGRDVGASNREHEHRRREEARDVDEDRVRRRHEPYERSRDARACELGNGRGRLQLRVPSEPGWPPRLLASADLGLGSHVKADPNPQIGESLQPALPR